MKTIFEFGLTPVLSGAWTSVFLLAGMIGANSARGAEAISLAGEWQFEIGRTNPPALTAQLPGTIQLPGTMDQAGLGPKNTKAPTLEGPYRIYDYAGPACYQREIEDPRRLAGKTSDVVPRTRPLGHAGVAGRQVHGDARQPDRAACL